jgi:hypothetical protein
MKLFLVMQVEQGNKKIKLNLHHYVQEMLAEYKDCINLKKMLPPKRIPMSPCIVLKPEDNPTIPDQHRQKLYMSFVAHSVCSDVDPL